MKKNLVLAGLLAAMVCVATSLLHITIPGGTGGYVHLGDAVIYLAAALLPTPYAVAASAIGSGLADVLVAPLWAPFTIVIKAVMALTFTAKKERLLCRRNVFATLLAGIVCVVGYYIAEVIILWMGGDFGSAAFAALAAVPFNGAQALASGIAFILLAVALDRLNLKRWLTRFK